MASRHVCDWCGMAADANATACWSCGGPLTQDVTTEPRATSPDEFPEPVVATAAAQDQHVNTDLAQPGAPQTQGYSTEPEERNVYEYRNADDVASAADQGAPASMVTHESAVHVSEPSIDEVSATDTVAGVADGSTDIEDDRGTEPCQRCGASVADGSLICGNCGKQTASLGNASWLAPVAAGAAIISQTGTEPQGWLSKAKSLITRGDGDIASAPKWLAQGQKQFADAQKAATDMKPAAIADFDGSAADVSTAGREGSPTTETEATRTPSSDASLAPDETTSSGDDRERSEKRSWWTPFRIVLVGLVAVIVAIAAIPVTRTGVTNGMARAVGRIRVIQHPQIGLEQPSRVVASSTLSGRTQRSILDSSLATYWAPDPATSVVGSYIIIAFDTAVSLDRIGIVLGIQNGDATWENNPRIKTATLQADDTTQIVKFDDVKDLQIKEIRPIHTAKIKLTIESTYPGSLDGNEWTAISVLAFFAEQ